MNTAKTYVLFGDNQAIQIYKLSVTQLLMSSDLIYQVKAYKDDEQTAFFKEKRNWKDVIEISFDDYKKIKKHLKPPQINKLMQLFGFIA